MQCISWSVCVLLDSRFQYCIIWLCARLHKVSCCKSESETQLFITLHYAPWEMDILLCTLYLRVVWFAVSELWLRFWMSKSKVAIMHTSSWYGFENPLRRGSAGRKTFPSLLLNRTLLMAPGRSGLALFYIFFRYRSSLPAVYTEVAPEQASGFWPISWKWALGLCVCVWEGL